MNDGVLIVLAALVAVVLAYSFWPELRALAERWHEWRIDRAFRRRATKRGRV